MRARSSVLAGLLALAMTGCGGSTTTGTTATISEASAGSIQAQIDRCVANAKTAAACLQGIREPTGETVTACAGGAVTNGSCVYARTVREGFVPPLPGDSTTTIMVAGKPVTCARDAGVWRCVRPGSQVWVTLKAP